jgi:hypothetical protein
MFGSMASFRKYAVDQRERHMFFVVVAPFVVFRRYFFSVTLMFFRRYFFSATLMFFRRYFFSATLMFFRRYFFSVTLVFFRRYFLFSPVGVERCVLFALVFLIFLVSALLHVGPSEFLLDITQYPQPLCLRDKV